ncbi:hypothetical protein SRB5_62490 [Streptomyces sp. RB5]|uniref:Lipoprotein n=1 Tax=Streptomyces smaragdinus TaxID=2585196 RepID=A0A7K0CRD7_9ACTN|nr:hypothetical protein [Streptomyces smaragdinus]MQY16057.1 hypothetical protein [Streptomyces smaragdinus]
MTHVRRWTALAALTMLAMTGCGGSAEDGGDEVAAVSSAKPSGQGEAKTELAEYIAGKQTWVTCMREAGVDLPDPDAKGQVEIDIPAKEWKGDPKYRTAQEKCADKQPALPESVEKANQPDLTAEEKDRNRRYAACMQGNGAPDFPDIGEDGRFLEENWDSSSSSGKRASRTCDKEVYGLDTSTIVPKG